nr:hypothetical protein Q903MT_gene1627 [Picea sitchensis]
MLHERWQNRCMMKQTCMMEMHALSTKHHDAHYTMTYVTKCTPGSLDTLYYLSSYHRSIYFP